MLFSSAFINVPLASSDGNWRRHGRQKEVGEEERPGGEKTFLWKGGENLNIQEIRLTQE